MAKTLTPQEVFDQTVEHLHRQGGPAMDNSSPPTCVYRGKYDRRCAIGFWIPDDKYKPELESLALHSTSISADIGSYLRPEVRSRSLIRILQELQRSHDLAWHAPDGTWADPYDQRKRGIAANLLQTAADFNLDSTKVLTLWPPTSPTLSPPKRPRSSSGDATTTE
jgi:hypothetical protein